VGVFCAPKGKFIFQLMYNSYSAPDLSD